MRGEKMKKNNMPKLFDVTIIDKDEVKASKFIVKLQEKGFIGANKIYLENYINAEIGIAFSHIKLNYKNYVIQSNWPEEKFEDIINIIAKDRKMLIPSVFLSYGAKYDSGKLTREIRQERLKYEMKNNPDDTSDEDELLEYIRNNGGR